jgi:hypothetical protein
MIGKWVAIFGVVLMAGCSSNQSIWSRVDGKPVDVPQFQAVMAQCKAEGAQNAPGWVGSGLGGMAIAASASHSKQNDIVNGCLARNGYIQTAAQ